MPDRTITSWNSLASAYKACFGVDRPGYALRTKLRRLEEARVEGREADEHNFEREDEWVAVRNGGQVQQVQTEGFAKCLAPQQLAQITDTMSVNEVDPILA